MKPTWKWIIAIAVTGFCFLSGNARGESDVFQTQALPDLPRSAEHGAIGAHGSTLLAIVPSDTESPGGPAVAYRLTENDEAWRLADSLKELDVPGAVASTPAGVVLIGGTREDAPRDGVTLLAWDTDTLTRKPLPPLPVSGNHTPAAAALGSTVYVLLSDPPGVAGTGQLVSLDLAAETPAWRDGPGLNEAVPSHAEMVALQDSLYVFGETAGGPVAYRLDTKRPGLDAGWQAIAAPPVWTPDAAGVPFGHSHIYLFSSADERDAAHRPVLAYHTFTDT